MSLQPKHYREIRVIAQYRQSHGIFRGAYEHLRENPRSVVGGVMIAVGALAAWGLLAMVTR